MGNTTKLWGYSGGYGQAQGLWGYSGGWQPAKAAWVYDAGTWKGIYSVLSVTGTSNVSHGSSGASSSGGDSGSGGVTGVSGNIGSLSYSWSYLSGDGVIVPDNSAAATPTWSRSFSGVANGTSSSASASWRCTITDAQTGATTTADISIGLQWTNTIPAFTFQRNPFPGPTSPGANSGICNAPAGANTVRIYIIGGGGQGGSGIFQDGDHLYNGGGAASGARAVWSGAASNFTYSAGGPRTGSSVSGVASATAGGDGGNAEFNAFSDGFANPGGNTASGGNEANDPGNGATGITGGSGQSTPIGNYGTGGDGGAFFEGGHMGQEGIVIFEWSA